MYKGPEKEAAFLERLLRAECVTCTLTCNFSTVQFELVSVTSGL